MFELPYLLPTLNEWERMHWASRRRYKRKLARNIGTTMLITGQRFPDLSRYPRADVRVERHSSRSPDNDNLTASVKPLLDALQPASNKRKYGLGLILEDNPDTITLDVQHVKARRSHTRVEVTYRD